MVRTPPSPCRCAAVPSRRAGRRSPTLLLLRRSPQCHRSPSSCAARAPHHRPSNRRAFAPPPGELAAPPLFLLVRRVHHRPRGRGESTSRHCYWGSTVAQRRRVTGRGPAEGLPALGVEIAVGRAPAHRAVVGHQAR
jgi:hypothetical protein